jgi:sugar phosphate isomerase/epimerase
MTKLQTKVGFLPIIGDNREGLIKLFRKLGPKAEQASVVLGLNTQLNAAENIHLLDEIGSPAVRIAYNVGEAVDAKRDVYQELRDLKAHRIAQIIPTLSDGVWLENDKRIDVPKLKAVLDEIGWSGWLVLQRSRDEKNARDVRYNFSANARYLRSIFQEKNAN